MRKTRGFLFTAGIALATAFTISCSSDDGDSGGTCSANFRTVIIGTQTWAAENLNCDVSGSKCYGDDPANCNKYGRLYDWATAMDIDAIYNSSYWNGSDVKHKGICPSGWHIPSNDDWDALMTTVGGSSTAGTKLKAENGWNEHETYGNGTNESGFSALPGGYGSSSGSFNSVGYYGIWQSATEYTNQNSEKGNLSGRAYYRVMRYDRENAHLDDDIGKSTLFSVRCVKD